LRGSFSDRKNGIAQPTHAEGGEFLVEEVDTKLTCKERNVFDDGQTNTPLFVFGQLNNGWQKGLR